MCTTYNKIGSLTTLKLRLEENNIHDFKSLKEVIDFQKNYSTIRQQSISHHENLIEEEKNKLEIDLPTLTLAIEVQIQQTVQRLTSEIDKLKLRVLILKGDNSTNYFKKLNNNLSKWNYKRKIKRYENCFEPEVKISIRQYADQQIYFMVPWANRR